LTARAPEGPPSDERLEEPYLPLRTEFTVILDQPIGTQVAAAERTFSARVRHPVRSPDNEIVLQTGAHLHGRVLSIESSPALSVKIRFDDVETTWGPMPIAATVRSAEPYASSTSGVSSGTAPYDAAFYLPASNPAPVAAIGVGGGPRMPGEAAILLPKGAELRIMLVRPIVAPPHVRSRR
jgi:hypothetical protein